MMTITPAAVTTGGQATKPLVGGRAGMDEETTTRRAQGAELKMLGAAGGKSQDDGKKMAANI